MGSLEKTVKLACKPKAAPPKSKYIEPIINATWDEEGGVEDVCRALQPRFREPNAIVVFKALIVLHTMIRNGNTDNVLGYLSKNEVLHLRNVSAGNWEGYNAPQNMQHYAIYLDSRIRAYRDLKHDAVKVQSEHNQDMRLSRNAEQEFGHVMKSSRSKPSSTSGGGLQRGKTLAGRKLRVMTVEKGLLRETKAVQKQIDTLVECRFYLDDLEDPLTITALRMLVQDLLILFSAGNEGVINVLEHYFEMSHVDAESALAIYRHFCKQCEKVVEYLGVAKKLQNLLNVNIPNMKHAPVSLAGALKEYLDDPNFEQNRIEYKLQKESAEKNGKASVAKKSADKSAKANEPVKTGAPATSSAAVTASTAAKPAVPPSVADFFESIEQAQSPMFNPQTESPTNGWFQQQATFNPFAAMQAQATGMPFMVPQVQQPQQPFIQPQATAVNPFSQFQAPVQQQQQLSPFGQSQQQSPFGNAFLQPQATGFLQPQMTGVNPFRPQTMVQSQMTGMPSFGDMGQQPQQGQQAMFNGQGTGATPLQLSASPFGTQGQGQGAGGLPGSAMQSGSPPLLQSSSSNPFPFLSQAPPSAQANTGIAPPARPGSAPLLSTMDGTSGSPAPQPVKTHQTGSKNPFGAVVQTPPPVPKPPTMMEIAMGMHVPGSNGAQQQPQQLQPQKTGFGGLGTGAGSNMASVASSFAFGGKPDGALSPQATSTTASGSIADTLFSTATGATGMTATSSAPSLMLSAPGQQPVQPQATGFGGVRAFKPSSSFGASLLESLPPIPSSGASAPGDGGLATGLGSLSLGQPNGSGTSSPANASSSITGIGNSFGNLGALNSQSNGLGAQATGSPFQKTMLGTGLRPQATGAANGPINPFRSTVFSAGLGTPMSTPAFGGADGGARPMTLFGQATGAPPSAGASLFGGGAFGASPGLGQPQGGQQPPFGQQQQQQQQFASLI